MLPHLAPGRRHLCEACCALRPSGSRGSRRGSEPARSRGTHTLEDGELGPEATGMRDDPAAAGDRLDSAGHWVRGGAQRKLPGSLSDSRPRSSGCCC